jgi:hypothetical protein
MTVPAYLPYFMMAGTAATLIAIIYGLQRSFAATSWPVETRNRTFLTTLIVLGGWFFLALALSAAGFYHVQSGEMPTIQFGLVPPILIGAWLIWRSETMARIIDAIPQPWLIGIPFYRALGVIFLILYAGDKLPGLFALPAGIGDMIIGLSAPLVALAYAKSPLRTAGLVRIWNVLGILDLTIAVSTGFITAPSRLFTVDFQPNSDLMTVLPLVLVPVYLVPLSIVLHLASLAKLHRDTAPVVSAKRVANA